MHACITGMMESTEAKCGHPILTSTESFKNVRRFAADLKEKTLTVARGKEQDIKSAAHDNPDKFRRKNARH